MASGRTIARRAAYEVATTLSRYPAVASRAARMWNIGTPVDDATDVVIEGFPRSGNTAVFAAFSVAQPSAIRIAHHTHTPANAIAGVRRGLPVLVLIRAPDEAVREMMQIRPELTVRQAARGYRRFYAPLLPFRDRIVVGRFDDVIVDLGAVIEQVNERFGSDFILPSASPGDPDAETIERRYWEDRAGRGLPVLGRSVGGRNGASRSEVDAVYGSPAFASVRRELTSLYGEFAAP